MTNAGLMEMGAAVRHFAYQNVSFDFHLILEDRKTLSVIVFPTQELLVKAPLRTSNARIEDFLRRKFRWVLKQKRYFSQFRAHPERRYVSGETFKYRGRSHKLLVHRCTRQDRVSLTHGTLTVFSSKPCDRGHTRALLDGWYSGKARKVFAERLRECFSLFDHSEMPGLMVRKMSRRWGSYSHATGRVILNTDLIRASTRHIDYVIIHELCHVAFRKHNRAFYELLESKLPRWKDLKTELELNLLG